MCLTHREVRYVRRSSVTEQEHRKVRERRISTVSAGAGGVIGGVVKMLGGG